MFKVKPAIQRLLQFLGYELRRRSAPGSLGFEVERTRARCQRFVQDFGITLLLDVGANIGQYGHAMRSLGYQGRMVSFEPLSASYEALRRNAEADRNWQCRHVALGDSDCEAQINVAGVSQCSSLLPMQERHIEVLPESKYCGSETIRLARLDSIRSEIVEPSDRIWLKLDVQGFEKNVLLGATETLDQVEIIDTELSLVTLYDNQPLFLEMVTFLQKAGFDPISLENGFVDPRTRCALQVDGIFARRSSLPGSNA